jgi:hypothetical protein
MRLYNLFEEGRALRIAFGITMLSLLLAGGTGAVRLTIRDDVHDQSFHQL